jgi:hypothetical protein
MDEDDNDNDIKDERQEITSSLANGDDIKKDKYDHKFVNSQAEHSSRKISHSDDTKNILLFKEMYRQAIIESFEILGKQVSGVVINYLEEKHSIRLEDTVDNPLVLDEVLEDAINGGRRIVERKIIKTLNNKLKIRINIIESNPSDFAENISKLKKLYLGRKASK